MVARWSKAMTAKNLKFSDERLGVFCCGHLFRRERKAKLVARPGGDWQFVCGSTDHVDPNEPYHVAIGVLTEIDSTLNEVADLLPEWGAEREEVGGLWIKLESSPTNQ